MSHGLVRDGWPSGATVIKNRDIEIESLRKQLEMAEACLAGDNTLIVGLKNDISEKDAEIDSYKTSYESTHAQNLCLADQLGESEAELIALRQQLSAANAEIERLKFDLLLPTQTALAASQAREQQLREALVLAKIQGSRRDQTIIIDAALAMPTDTTALQSLIAKAGEVMRERCERMYWVSPSEFNAQLIRALPGVTLEGLK